MIFLKKYINFIINMFFYFFPLWLWKDLWRWLKSYSFIKSLVKKSKNNKITKTYKKIYFFILSRPFLLAFFKRFWHDCLILFGFFYWLDRLNLWKLIFYFYFYFFHVDFFWDCLYFVIFFNVVKYFIKYLIFFFDFIIFDFFKEYYLTVSTYYILRDLLYFNFYEFIYEDFIDYYIDFIDTKFTFTFYIDWIIYIIQLIYYTLKKPLDILANLIFNTYLNIVLSYRWFRLILPVLPEKIKYLFYKIKIKVIEYSYYFKLIWFPFSYMIFIIQYIFFSIVYFFWFYYFFYKFKLTTGLYYISFKTNLTHYFYIIQLNYLNLIISFYNLKFKLISFFLKILNKILLK